MERESVPVGAIEWSRRSVELHLTRLSGGRRRVDRQQREDEERGLKHLDPREGRTVPCSPELTVLMSNSEFDFPVPRRPNRRDDAFVDDLLARPRYVPVSDRQGRTRRTTPTPNSAM